MIKKLRQHETWRKKRKIMYIRHNLNIYLLHVLSIKKAVTLQKFKSINYFFNSYICFERSRSDFSLTLEFFYDINIIQLHTFYYPNLILYLYTAKAVEMVTSTVPLMICAYLSSTFVIDIGLVQMERMNYRVVMCY